MKLLWTLLSTSLMPVVHQYNCIDLCYYFNFPFCRISPSYHLQMPTFSVSVVFHLAFFQFLYTQLWGQYITLQWILWRKSLFLQYLLSPSMGSRSQSQNIAAASGTWMFSLEFSPGSTIICPLNSQFVLCLSAPCVKMEWYRVIV